MILDILDRLNQKKIILASQSPRRQQLLADIGLNYTIVSSGVDEDTIESIPQNRSEKNAKLKAQAIKENNDYDLIIGCDTVVSFAGHIFEKPKSKDEAFDILTKLSGKSHDVFSSVALFFKTKEIIFTEKTRVELFQLHNSFIHMYINSEEPMDKAGAYGIQKTGSSFVKSVNGCYYNVMGLPVSRICLHLKEAYSQGLI